MKRESETDQSGNRPAYKDPIFPNNNTKQPVKIQNDSEMETNSVSVPVAFQFS